MKGKQGHEKFVLRNAVNEDLSDERKKQTVCGNSYTQKYERKCCGKLEFANDNGCKSGKKCKREEDQKRLEQRILKSN